MTEKKAPTREEIIKAHCEAQQCDGCPAEQECNEAEAQEEARQEEVAFASEADPYDGEDFDY